MHVAGDAGYTQHLLHLAPGERCSNRPHGFEIEWPSPFPFRIDHVVRSPFTRRSGHFTTSSHLDSRVRSLPRTRNRPPAPRSVARSVSGLPFLVVSFEGKAR